MAIFKSALVVLFAIVVIAHADEKREKKHAHAAYSGIQDGAVGSLGYTGQGYGYQPYGGAGLGLGYGNPGYGSPGYGAGWNTPSYTAAWPQTTYGYGAGGYGAGYGSTYGAGYGAQRHGGYGGYPGAYGHGHHSSGYLG